MALHYAGGSVAQVASASCGDTLSLQLRHCTTGGMNEPDRHADPDQPLAGASTSQLKLEYAREHSARHRELTPEQERRFLLWCIAITFLAMVAWCFTMFWTRRPALDYFCVFAFTPMILATVWVILGWQLLSLIRRYPQPHRRRMIAVVILAFLLAPYSLIRAGADMFTLSVRYHLWRAGGADKVRIAFNQWVATRPEYDATGRKMLFDQLTPGTGGGNIVRLPVTQFPPEVRYMHERFPSRFGTTWEDVAYLDNVTALTTTDIMIGPAGWEPDGDLSLWSQITGSRRKVADGIWIQFGVYNK
jgi:hypothetical protein